MKAFVSCLISFLTSMTLCVQAEADEMSQKTSLEAAIGFASPSGLVGVGGRYFLNDSLAIHANFGIDFTGLMSGAGARYYSPSREQTCYFLVECSNRFTIGATFSGVNRSNSTTIDVDGDKGQYRHTSGTAVHLGLGSFAVFQGQATSGFEIGRRLWIKRPKHSFIEGVENSEQHEVLDSFVKDSLYLSISLGILL